MPSPPARALVSRPDLLGSLLAVAAVGTLALGAVQGPVWGWGDPRTIASFVASALLTPLLVWRCARHPAPVLELGLFRGRSFATGNLGALLLGTSFFGLILANSLYLTQVWDYSVLRAGLAIAPGPLASSVAAILAGRFTDRVDPRRFIVPGAVVSAVSGVWLATQVGPEPAFLAEWLPATLLMGVGVGLGFATIVAVCVRDLGPAQLGIGSGMSATTRQLGAVLGVAILVAVLGPAPGAGSYDAGWWAMAALALLAVIPVALIGRQAAAPGHGAAAA
jgi:MFS family permease